jgi:hypothetical protein
MNIRRQTISAIRATALAAALSLPALPRASAGPAEDLSQSALAAVTNAGRYFAEKLAVDGSYVYDYRPDLKERRAEGAVGPSIGWVEPPGTPEIGAAFLKLYEMTGDEFWLTEARKSADALLRSQLNSGGWNNVIETDPTARQTWCYRVNRLSKADCRAIANNKARDRSILDDDTTQSVIRFLILLDKATGGNDPAIRDAALYALNGTAHAQYGNGAWSITFESWKSLADAPVRFASIPPAWSRTWVKPQGGPFYITNDNVLRDLVGVFLLANDHFGNPSYLDIAVHTGEFLLLSQLPGKQRGWAQTYSADMEPVWGRPFEPPAISSYETAGAADTLLELYRRTKDQRFLQAAKDAASWLTSVRQPDGKWARFYELETDRPLFVDGSGNLTYDPMSLHRGYMFRGTWDIPQVLERVAAAGKGELAPRPYWPSAADKIGGRDNLEAQVRAISVRRRSVPDSWIDDGWIRSQAFIDSVFIVDRYLNRHD